MAFTWQPFRPSTMIYHSCQLPWYYKYILNSCGIGDRSYDLRTPMPHDHITSVYFALWGYMAAWWVGISRPQMTLIAGLSLYKGIHKLAHIVPQMPCALTNKALITEIAHYFHSNPLVDWYFCSEPISRSSHSASQSPQSFFIERHFCWWLHEADGDI